LNEPHNIADTKKEIENAKASELQQMSLLVDEKPLWIDRSKLPFQYTGERFKEQEPERYAVAVELIAANRFSDRSIAAFVHANPRTIKQVRLTQITDIQIQREILKQKFFVQTAVLGDQLLEVAHDCKDVSKLAIAQGIAKDGYLAVSGLPTARIEVNHTFDLGAELRKLNDEAREAIKQAKAHVVEPAALENGEPA
jgi:hypothetical protein